MNILANIYTKLIPGQGQKRLIELTETRYTVMRDSNSTSFLSVIVYRLAFNCLQHQNNRLSVIVFAAIVYRKSYIIYRLLFGSLKHVYL